MYQLVYISAAALNFVESDLPALLDKSQRNNAKKQITGMLMYHEGQFFQILEGPED